MTIQPEMTQGTPMSIHRNLFGKLALSTFLIAAVGGVGHAQDATAVVERFRQIVEMQGLKLSWSSVSGDASAIVVEGLKVAPANGAKPADLGKVTFKGVTEENGGYTIESISTEPFTMTQDGMTVSASPFSLTGVKLPATTSTDPVASLLFYDGAKLASFTVKKGDKTAFAMENLSAEITPPADGKPMAFTTAAETFTADLSLVEDPQSKAAIDAMGYQTISGFFELEGTWQPTDGRLGLTKYDVSVANAGTFGMTFDLGGYTSDFIKAMQDMQKKMAEQPAGADDSAQGLAMLGMMQQLTFHSASLRWDDDSLTGKVLDYVAKMQNMKPDDIRNQAKAIVPFLTAQLNNPDLSTQISAAINAYLDAPKSLEISAKPPAPVPFSQLAASGMSAPLDLPKTLGISVTANQDE